MNSSTILSLKEIPLQADLFERYRIVRETTRWICEPLTIEDCVVQTAIECSPVKWQLAHTTWFFETFVLIAHDTSYKPFHSKFNYLFNSYYNAVGARTPRDLRGQMSRPTMEEVWHYREHVDRAMERFCRHELPEDIFRTIELGLNHEQQHQELIVTDVKTVLAMNPLRPVYREREIRSAAVPAHAWVSFDEGLYEFGARGNDFYFDNEGPRHRQYLDSFAIGNRLITCGEYLAFIRDGGYRTPSLWLSDGWARVAEEAWNAPKYWEPIEDEWWQMTLQGLRRIEDSEPVVHVSHYEADAFATWYGARLPTELEWELVATNHPPKGNFLENGNFHPVPLDVNSEPIGQLFGDVWEWTRSAYLPYPGFTVAPGALGEYNGKFMSNQMVLRGGSCVTPRHHIRPTYRNFFPSESRWQFSGIRLATTA